MAKNQAGWNVYADHIYESFPIFTLKRSTRENPRTGAVLDYVRIDGLDWVNVFAFTTNKKLVLIRQYRHGAEEFTIELPGGCVEDDEKNDPAQTAMRELREETGYALSKTGTIEYIGNLSPNPALMGNRIHFYLLKGVECMGDQQLDCGESIEVVLKDWQEFLQEIRDGRISHALNIAALGLIAAKQGVEIY